MPSFPLTVIERYFYHEDRPAYPCWIISRFRFSGGFRHDALQRAWEKVVPRHPLLSRVVKRGGLGRLVWVPALDYRPKVEWVVTLADNGWPEWQPTDLTKAPGVRVIGHEHEGSTCLYIYTHHSLHDGAGLFAIIEDLLGNYSVELGVPVLLMDYQTEQFPSRNKFGLNLWKMLKLVPIQLLGLAASVPLHWRRPRTLVPDKSRGKWMQPRPSLPALVSRELPPADSEWLGHTAKLLGTPLHHLFLRDALAGVGAWLKRRPDATPLGWIYMLVPVNLRRPSDLLLPAANLVGMVVIDRQLKSLWKRERLLQRIDEDMSLIKRGRLGLVFLLLLSLAGLIPGGIRRYARSYSRGATFLITNLGDVFAASKLRNADGKLAVPGAVMEGLNIAAPCRPGTQAALAVGFYAGKFWADIQYDSRYLTRSDADSLIEEFLNQLRLSAESVG